MFDLFMLKGVFIMYEFISKNEQDTINFADKFANNLNKNSVIILTGDLGSRKNQIYRRNFKALQLRR